MSRKYVDNAKNRKLGRVGLPYGSAVDSSISSSSAHGRDISSLSLRAAAVTYPDDHVKAKVNKYRGSHEYTVTDESGILQNQKVYKDNYFNRKNNRVGLPLGSAPISRTTEAYRNTKLEKVGKTPNSKVVSKEKLASLHTSSEEHFDEEIPKDLDALSEDAVNCVLGFRKREQTDELFLEKNYNTNRQPQEHAIAELFSGYKGTVIDFEKLQMGPKIGHGKFGEVFFASLDGEAVAVKKLQFQKATKKCLEQFQNEMTRFIELNHSNIVSFFGTCTAVPNLAIVMEFMDMSLFDAVHKTKVTFTVKDKLEIMRGMTQGIAHLHFKNIAHCDLKSRNILLVNVHGLPQTVQNEPVWAKITGFGLSKMKSDKVASSSLTATNIETLRYMAPELLQRKILTFDGMKHADIYSLGLLIQELVLEETPFEDLTYEQLKVNVGVNGLKPVILDDLRLDARLYKSLGLCWSQDPNDRPSAVKMAEVASILTSLFDEGEE